VVEDSTVLQNVEKLRTDFSQNLEIRVHNSNHILWKEYLCDADLFRNAAVGLALDYRCHGAGAHVQDIQDGQYEIDH